MICNKRHQPQVDLFAVGFNNKLPQFVSPVSDSLGSGCTQSALGGSGLLCLPSNRHPLFEPFYGTSLAYKGSF